MDIDAQELGRRLQLAREAAGLTQQAAAGELGLTRGSIAQVEGGARAPNSLQLVALARRYGRDPADFLAPDFEADAPTALQALFRAEMDIAGDPERAQAVRQCIELRREFAELEALLGAERQGTYGVRYELPAIRTRYEAVRHGEALAASERGRLGIGDEPIPSLVLLVQSQGIWVGEVNLPDNISGFTLHDRADGISIFANRDHHPRRRRFSYAHEYCHAIADWSSASVVSRQEERAEFCEVRANAFAAAFLLPATGVHEFMAGLGKGRIDRSLQVFDEQGALIARERSEAKSRAVAAHDVELLRRVFGVSYEAALYRLQNLGLITNDQRQALGQQRDLAEAFPRLPPELTEAEGDHPARRLVRLAVEAFQAGLVSAGRLRELCVRAGLDAGEVDELLFTLTSEQVASLEEVPPEHELVEA